jgi:dihydrofolate reductase
MRKVVMLNRISMDGFFAGPNGETHEWFINDPGVDKAVHKMMQPDTVLMGRVTYQLFESYWPKVATDPKAPKELKKISRELNEMTKLVFSNTLNEVTWENSKLFRGGLENEIRRIKQGSGKDMVIFGSGTIVQQLTREKLIDEYLFVITPTILGAGKPLFNYGEKLDLKLLKEKTFESGNTLLHYSIDKEKKNSAARKQPERERELQEH